jgi:hypothetical protein
VAYRIPAEVVRGLPCVVGDSIGPGSSSHVRAPSSHLAATSIHPSAPYAPTLLLLFALTPRPVVPIPIPGRRLAPSSSRRSIDIPRERPRAASRQRRAPVGAATVVTAGYQRSPVAPPGLRSACGDASRSPETDVCVDYSCIGKKKTRHSVLG